MLALPQRRKRLAADKSLSKIYMSSYRSRGEGKGEGASLCLPLPFRRDVWFGRGGRDERGDEVNTDRE